jgi:hypothetical protein
LSEGGDYDPGAFRSWVSMLGEQAGRNQVSEALAKSRGGFGFGLACVLTVAGMPANCRRHAKHGQWGGNKKRGERLPVS